MFKNGGMVLETQSGREDLKFIRKCKKLKRRLRRWKREVFGNMAQQKDDLSNQSQILINEKDQIKSGRRSKRRARNEK